MTKKIWLLSAMIVAAGWQAEAQGKPDYTSRVPQFKFGTSLTEQEQQLRENPLVQRFDKSRAAKANDPYRPLYHFVSPEGNLNDPNGLCFWQGHWHLFYQGYPPDDPRQHWGHAVSEDLLHWRDLPYAIYPKPEEKCFSGATLVEQERVIAMYHGTKIGNMVATASDPLLLNWEKVAGRAVIPIANPDGSPLPYRVFDPCIWRTGDYYYSISGATQPTAPDKKTVPLESLFRSKDLANWEYMHPFVEGDRFTNTGDDGACPYFWPIADRHILLFFSHTSGGQYLLGDYDTTAQKFNATAHGKFNHGAVMPGGVHAPSAAPDGQGGVITIFNVNPGKATRGWNQVMNLPLRLTLSNREDLGIEPAVDTTSLRFDHRQVVSRRLPANQELLLPEVAGNAIEIEAEIDPSQAQAVELFVLRSDDRQEYTRIALYQERGYRSMPWNTIRRVSSAVVLDNSCSSILPEARSRLPETAQLFLPEKESFKLRIFIDRSLVEVFVNGKQYLACRVYPGLAHSTGVSMRAQGGEALLKKLDVWQMRSIYAAHQQPTARAGVEAVKDILLADFEGDDFGAWHSEGSAFGSGPARGSLGGQMKVTGFKGRGLANSFNGGDRAIGVLTSPPFVIERKHINFLMGGGGWAGRTGMNLIVDGKCVRSASGTNIKPGGSEELMPVGWDVAEFLGRSAQLQIVDSASGGWGHINVDHIVASDTPLPKLLTGVKRELKADKRWLLLPVKNGAPKRQMELRIGEERVRFFDIELAAAAPEWWAVLDVGAWQGQELTLWVDKLPEDSQGLAAVKLSDSAILPGEDYREPLRPQLHFSPRRGWHNDPNGLVFYNGEYHLFFQHNPYGTGWGNMHWGHAVSQDLVHWQEVDEALYPDELGTMYSGSAVVDHHNSSGFGKDGKSPLILIYTAAGNPRTQCIAWSLDGRNFTKYDGNPVLPNISRGNRDPKVFWHQPTKRWLMVLYVDRPDKFHTMELFASKNLRQWQPLSVIAGDQGGGTYLYECPDLFELSVNGSNQKRWVLFGADGQYALGAFDGVKFMPEAERLPGHWSKTPYAAQTFDNAPNDRRILIPWLRAPSPGMSFNQCMGLPQELSLIKTPVGIRLARQPVAELKSLRVESKVIPAADITPSSDNPLQGLQAELIELEFACTLTRDTTIELSLRGVPIAYDSTNGILRVAEHPTPWPLENNTLALHIFLDRTSVEIFSADGLCYLPLAVIPTTNTLTSSLKVSQGSARITRGAFHRLNSIWH